MRYFFVLFLLSMSHLTSILASMDDMCDAPASPPRIHSPFDFGRLFDPHLLSPPAPSAACILDTCAQKLASIHPRDAKSTQKYLDVLEDLTKAYHQEGTDVVVATELAHLCAKTLLDLLKNPHLSFPLALENRHHNREGLTRYATYFAQKSADSILLARAYTALALNTQKNKIIFQNETLTKPQLLYWSYKMLPENACAQQATTLLMLLKFWKDDILPIDGAVQSRQSFVQKLYATSLSHLISQSYSRSIHFKMYTLWHQTKPFSVFGVTVERHTLDESAEKIRATMRRSLTKRSAFAPPCASQTPEPRTYPACLQGVDSLGDLISRALPAGTTLTPGDQSLFYYQLF